MKRTVPFTKTITFRTMISEITDIEVTHNLKLENDFSPKEVEAVIIHYSIWTKHSGRQESVILKLESVLAFFIHLIECFNILMYR